VQLQIFVMKTSELHLHTGKMVGKQENPEYLVGMSAVFIQNERSFR